MTMASSSEDETRSIDEEKALLSEESRHPNMAEAAPLNAKLWISIAVNTIATVAIVRQ